MIKEGRLIQEISIEELRRSRFKTYIIEFFDQSDLDFVQKAYPHAQCRMETKQLTVSVSDGQINALLGVLAGCRVRSLSEEKHTLEEYFMKFYGGSRHD